MWSLVNNTPFVAERGWTRDKTGAEVWLVAVKGTFFIAAHGPLRLSDDQIKVCLAPQFRGEASQGSLLYDSDMPRTKVATDVIVHGHAQGGNKKGTMRVVVTLNVANIRKTVCVFGDRYWKRTFLGAGMTSPGPVIRVPLIYERGFGGTDQISEDSKHHGWEPRNPVGLGFATRLANLIGRRAPNVEDPNDLIHHWKDRPKPIGLGPIPGHWSPRLELAGTYDKRWEKERLPLLPIDFDDRFYQCAPKDQQVPGFLKGGELMTISNMTPTGFLGFHLPKVKIAFRTRFFDGSVEEHGAALHTIILEPDVPRVIVVWHTALECHHKVQKLRDTTIDLIKVDWGKTLKI